MPNFLKVLRVVLCRMIFQDWSPIALQLMKQGDLPTPSANHNDTQNVDGKIEIVFWFLWKWYRL